MGKKKGTTKKVLTPEQLKNQKLGEIFFACRRILKMTQVQFSEFLNVTQGTVSKIEAYDMKPEYYLVCHLCKLMKLSAQGVMDYATGETRIIPVKGYKELLAEEEKILKQKEAENKKGKKPGRKPVELNSPFEEFKSGGWVIGDD